MCTQLPGWYLNSRSKSLDFDADQAEWRATETRGTDPALAAHHEGVAAGLRFRAAELRDEARRAWERR